MQIGPNVRSKGAKWAETCPKSGKLDQKYVPKRAKWTKGDPKVGIVGQKRSKSGHSGPKVGQKGAKWPNSTPKCGKLDHFGRKIAKVNRGWGRGAQG